VIPGRGLALAVALLAAGWPAIAQDPENAPGRARLSMAGLSAQSLYLLRCSGCHQVDGQGATPAGVPPFPGFIDGLVNDEAGRTYVVLVPGVAGSGLADAQTAQVLNYVQDRWAQPGARPAPRFTAEEVARRRATPVSDVVAYRRALVARIAKRGTPIADYPWP
jgi:mono/diheme cytochrome c family protein